MACVSVPKKVAVADAALSAGDIDFAIELYREVLDRDARDPNALHGLARSFAARGDPEASLSIYAGLELFSSGYFPRAREDYLAALDLAAIRRGATGDAPGELRLLERIAARDPERAGLKERMNAIRLALAVEYLAEDRDTEAEALYRAVLEGQSHRIDAVLGLADIMVSQNRVAEAQVVIAAARRFHPDNQALEQAMVRTRKIRYPNVPARDFP